MLLAACKKFGCELIVAGGYVRACVAGELVNDIDCFTTSKAKAREVAEYVVELSIASENRKFIHESDNAYTITKYQTPIQIIHRWTFTGPRDAIMSFDFTISRAAFWWENVYKAPHEIDPASGDDTLTPLVDHERSGWHSICDSRFYSDLAAKRLVYTMPIRNEDAGGSMLRVLKYYQRGYRMPIDSLGAVIARLAMGVRTRAIEENDPDRWYLPIEVKLASELTKLLREVDPDIDPRHIAHLPAENQFQT